LRLALAYSVRDPVGSNASRVIVELTGGDRASCGMAVECFELGNIYLAGYDIDVIDLEVLDETPDPSADAVIVLSRHRAESGRRSLTVHHTGNPTRSTYGGDPETLSIAYPALSKILLKTYYEKAVETGVIGEYEVVLEATHHGPTGLRKPIVFIEVGSTPEDWRNPRAIRTLAETVVEVLDREPPNCIMSAGFGGTHYPVKFTRLQFESEYCIGHIIPKYAFKNGVGVKVLEQAILNNYPGGATRVLLEKKSLKGEYRRLVESIASSMGVGVERV